MSVASGTAIADGLIHWTLCYTDAQTYTDGVLPFVTEGLAAGEPVLVMAPSPSIDLLRNGSAASADRVTFLDMTDDLRNPARVIPAAQRFAETHPAPRIRVVGEPIWSGRSVAEVREGIRHEACVNILFADVAATVLCPYDAGDLPSSVLADAERTHPHLRADGTYRPNTRYVDPAITLSRSGGLPLAPGYADALSFHDPDGLGSVRCLVQDHARGAGIAGSDLADLLVAVNEIATNTLVHTAAGGTLRIWRDNHALVCEIADSGQITDPMAGRRAPGVDVLQPRGLWTANQVCDLVEIRSGRSGSKIRLHMRAG